MCLQVGIWWSYAVIVPCPNTNSTLFCSFAIWYVPILMYICECGASMFAVGERELGACGFHFPVRHSTSHTRFSDCVAVCMCRHDSRLCHRSFGRCLSLQKEKTCPQSVVKKWILCNRFKLVQHPVIIKYISFSDRILDILTCHNNTSWTCYCTVQ